MSNSKVIEEEEEVQPQASNVPQDPAPPKPTLIRRSTSRQQLVRRNSAARYGRRVLREWRNRHMFLGRYSIEKMLAFEEYQQHASPFRVFSVAVLTPVPALVIVVLLAAIPLQSPLLPASSNAAFFVQSWLSFSVITFGMLLYMRCALAIPTDVYPHWRGFLVAIFTAGANELVMAFISMWRRFPAPLCCLFGLSYALFFIFFHVLIVGSQIRPNLARIRAYLPLCFAQASTYFVFVSASITFKNASALGQAAITISFPVVRTVLKTIIRRYTNSLDDISTEVTVCVVELFGSLFQNVFLQIAKSLAVTGLTIATNLALAVMETKMFLEHKHIVDGRQTTRTAVKIIEHSFRESRAPRSIRESTGRGGVSVAFSAAEFSRHPRRRSLLKSPKRGSKIACATDRSVDIGSIDLGVNDKSMFRRASAVARSSMVMLSLSTATPRTRRSSIADADTVHRHHLKLLSQVLQVMYASEVLIFAEYAEVACTFVYGVYSLAVYHLPNAKYISPFLAWSELDFWQAMTNTAVYFVLAGCTMSYVLFLVRKKFGYYSFYQLAFVLEKYWLSVQGKLVVSFTLVFVLHVVHQGMGFSKFD